MAVATRETEIIITLVMDGDEAEFLRELTSNCLSGDLASEPMSIREARESIHNAIDKQLRKRK